MQLSIAIPNIVEYNIDANLQKVLSQLQISANSREIPDSPMLVLFPETVLTGLVISDDYDTDRLYALEITSTPITQICKQAEANKIWVAFGFIELAHGALYDTALLVNDNGEIALHQRRLTKGWCNPNAPRNKYGYGTKLATTITPWGKAAFLICGDLFHVPQIAADEKLDLLLFPYARCFGNISQPTPQQEWDINEWPAYATQVRAAGAKITLGANYIAPEKDSPFGGGFGGGFIANKDGNLLKSVPLQTEAIVVH